MAKAQKSSQERSTPKELVWFKGEIKTPPFSKEARLEAGGLLRNLQRGEKLSMPHAEPVTAVGPRCGALRVPDGRHNWRIMYRVDDDVIVIVDVYDKKTRQIPTAVIDRCKKRLKNYDDTVKVVQKNPPGKGGEIDGPKKA